MEMEVEKYRSRDIEGNIAYLLVCSLNARDSWAWARLKLGAWNSTQASHVDDMSSTSWARTRFLPGVRLDDTGWGVGLRLDPRHHNMRCLYPHGVLTAVPKVTSHTFKKFSGGHLWHSCLSCCLWHWHPRWVLVVSWLPCCQSSSLIVCLRGQQKMARVLGAWVLPPVS